MRQKGIRADLYPTDAKIQKQFKYADKRNVPYTILLGAKELENGVFLVKDMKSGEQKEYALSDLSGFENFLGLTQ